MEFGLDKRAPFIIKRGEIVKTEGIKMLYGNLDEDDHYKSSSG